MSASNFDKAAATRAVESLEDLPPSVQIERAGTVYELVFGLDPWGDSSPSWLPGATTIRLWRGWDTHRELLQRIQAVRANAYNTVGSAATGRPISTVAARTPLIAYVSPSTYVASQAADYWGGPGTASAAASGFSEGFSEGLDRATDFGRGFLDKLEKFGPLVLLAAAGLAAVYVVRAVKG